MTTIGFEHLQAWVGRIDENADTITLPPVAKLAATFNLLASFSTGDALPPAWHWLFCTPTVPMNATGPDGHAQRGVFLPPVALPRRMWAGGRFTFFHPLKIGDTIRKKSQIMDISVKEGKTGTLIFLLLRHEIANDQGIALVEEQDIVYREAPKDKQVAPVAKPAPAEAQWSREIVPTPVLLFRYSALTFNSHRIHYDLKYCQEEEGYPGLVVHGPLIATLLLELLRENMPQHSLEKFSFRAISPLFDTHSFTINGRQDGNQVMLWALNHEQHLAMQAEATLTEKTSHHS